MSVRPVKQRIKNLLRHEVAALMGKASFVFACRIGGAALVFITQVLLARWMGAEQVGIYVYAFAWCTLLATIASLGLTSAVIRFFGKGLADADSALILSFSRRGREISLIASILITLIGAGLIIEIDGLIPSASKNTMLIALCAVPVYTLIRWYSSVANAMSWFRLAFLPRLIFRPLMLLIAVWLIWLTQSALSAPTVMIWHLVIMLIIAAAQFYLVERALHRRFPATLRFQYDTAVWLRTGIPLLITSLFINAFLELNVIVAGVFLSAEQIAVFNAAFRTAYLIGFGIQAMDVITAPSMAKLYAAGDKPSLQRVVSRATQIKFFGALFAVAGLILFGRSILGLFGLEFVAGYHALIILAFSQVIIAGLGAGVQLLNISGNQDQCLYIFLCSAVIMFGLHTVLAPRLGINGIAIGILLVVLIQSLWVQLVVSRRLNIFPAIVNFQKLLKKK